MGGLVGSVKLVDQAAPSHRLGSDDYPRLFAHYEMDRLVAATS